MSNAPVLGEDEVRSPCTMRGTACARATVAKGRTSTMAQAATIVAVLTGPAMTSPTRRWLECDAEHDRAGVSSVFPGHGEAQLIEVVAGDRVCTVARIPVGSRVVWRLRVD